jgi:GGDEF domain-containing protein
MQNDMGSMADAVMDAPQTSADAAAWKDITLLLLGATADHALDIGGTSKADFQKVLRESIDTFQHTKSTTQVLMSAGALSQAVSHYCGQNQKKIDALRKDTESAIQLFLKHLGSNYGESNVQGLRTAFEAALAEGNVEKALEPAERALASLVLPAAPAAVAAPDPAIAAAAQKKIAELEAKIAQLEKAPRTGAPVMAATSTVDSTTGLPVRSEAEAALKKALGSGTQAYAAVFYLHRMALTNARFGESIGNQVIMFCSQHIASLVARNNDALFRWSGPAFMAVLERNESEGSVAAEVQRLVSAPLSRFFETSARSVYLPVKVTADVIPLFETDYDSVKQRTENFILTASGQANPA